MLDTEAPREFRIMSGVASLRKAYRPGSMQKEWREAAEHEGTPEYTFWLEIELAKAWMHASQP